MLCRHKDITFIEGQNEYLKIHLKSGDPFLTHMTFDKILDMLPDNFIRIHRSYVVNMLFAVSVERKSVNLPDGTRLPVSDTRRASLFQYMNVE